MRKVITFVGSIAILFLLYQFGVTFFLKDHSLVYKIMKDNNTFEIKEDYHRFSKTEIYELAVKKDNITVYFTIKEKLHNQKQIVKTINFYEKDGMLCVKPTIIGNNQPEIMCSKGNETLSSSYLLSINNPIIISFIEELKSKEILHSSYSYTEKAETFFKDTVYQSNIMKDYTIGVWNYRGVNVYTKKDKKNLTPLTSDRYENTHSIMSNSYWIFPNYDLKYDFNSLYLINMEDLAKKTINLGDIMISFNSYFNGESGGKVYITDKSNYTQYMISTKTNKTELVGSKQIDGDYFDKEWSKISIYDLINTEKKFSKKDTYTQNINGFGNVTVTKVNESYYFKTVDGAIYSSHDKNFTKLSLLIKDNEIVDYKIIDDVIYYLKGDTIYQYTIMNGLKKIVKNNEFNYNSKNIFEVYKKS